MVAKPAKRPVRSGTEAAGSRRSPARADFGRVFERLERIMLEHGRGLEVVRGKSGEITLTGPVMKRWNKELWFGAVKVGKAYVSYHLMPVYMYPDLLEDVSPALKARMQGKSCFNFKKVDEELLAELDRLTAASVDRLRNEGDL